MKFVIVITDGITVELYHVACLDDAHVRSMMFYTAFYVIFLHQGSHTINLTNEASSLTNEASLINFVLCYLRGLQGVIVLCCQMLLQNYIAMVGDDSR